MNCSHFLEELKVSYNLKDIYFQALGMIILYMDAVFLSEQTIQMKLACTHFGGDCLKNKCVQSCRTECSGKLVLELRS